jgi:protein phosphatase
LQPEDAAHHQWRHVVTNAVGCGSPEVKVEVHKVHLEPGDKILLCSDGLTSMLSEGEISHVLEVDGDPEQSCRQLVARANEEGGKDNITVVLAHFYDLRAERGHAQTGGRDHTKRPGHVK